MGFCIRGFVWVEINGIVVGERRGLCWLVVGNKGGG